MKKGIDVSKWQGNIDWQKVKKAGIEFAILRASYGDGTSRFKNNGRDEQFERNYQEAKKVGIPVGAYHYCYARNIEEAKEEAEFFLSVIKGKQFEYPVILDLEDKNQDGINRAALTDMAIAFLDILEKNGYYAMLYSNKHWLENKLDYNRLKRFDIWLAQWAKEPTWKGNYGIWQYTSDGSVSGIQGRVDMNISYLDYPTIIKNAGLNGFGKPAAQPKPEPPSRNEPVKEIVYTVKKGDTLSKIAALFKTAVSKLVQINKIKNPDLIFPGQKIKIEGAQQEEKKATKEVVYVVKKGDTLWDIAKKYKTTVAKLAEDNKIKNPNLIYPGQRLIIK